jgi:hypothetical protein
MTLLETYAKESRNESRQVPGWNRVRTNEHDPTSGNAWVAFLLEMDKRLQAGVKL